MTCSYRVSPFYSPHPVSTEINFTYRFVHLPHPVSQESTFSLIYVCWVQVGWPLESHSAQKTQVAGCNTFRKHSPHDPQPTSLCLFVSVGLGFSRRDFPQKNLSMDCPARICFTCKAVIELSFNLSCAGSPVCTGCCTLSVEQWLHFDFNYWYLQ